MDHEEVLIETEHFILFKKLHINIVTFMKYNWAMDYNHYIIKINLKRK